MRKDELITAAGVIILLLIPLIEWKISSWLV
jgi:hypothetical protein